MGFDNKHVGLTLTAAQGSLVILPLTSSTGCARPDTAPPTTPALTGCLGCKAPVCPGRGVHMWPKHLVWAN